jgi:diguanylate cyclase (GGDEF)-like protein/PAS domain S-box-containing protein
LKNNEKLPNLNSPGDPHIMPNPTDINDSEQTLILDFASISADITDAGAILDLETIAFPDEKNRPWILSAIHVNAPDLQFMARCCLPFLIILYFAITLKPTFLTLLPIIIAFCALFFIFHIHIYRLTKQDLLRKHHIVTANQMDVAAAHLAWLIDPSDPAPMMMLVVIATIGNGVLHGFASFRSLIQITAWAAPLVYFLRMAFIGFEPLSLIFAALCAFLVFYTYVLSSRDDSLRLKNKSRATRLELDNYKLKQLGIALQKSEIRYRNIFDNSTAAMVLLENDMRISLVNASFEKLTQYSKNELYAKKRLSDIIYQDDLERIKRFHSRRKKMGGTTPTEYECKLVDKFNNIKHVIIRFNITQWHERIMATIEDVTVQKRSRAALLKSGKKLRETFALLSQSEKGYRNLFENTGTATILVEKNMRITMVNTKFTELTGYGKNEIIGKKRLSEFIERRNLFRIRRFQIKQKKKGLPLPTEYECLMIDKSKQMKYVVMKTYTPPEQDVSIVSFFDITQRKQAEAALQEAHERLQRLSTTDELTQVANRRHFNERLTLEWNRLKREAMPLSLIMCDVDCFKSYNDTYGHQRGDQCLSAIAEALKKAVKRSGDLVARYGGEEFTVIMPNTDLQGAFALAEKTRIAILNLKIPSKSSVVSPYVTLSLGVSSLIPSHLLTPDAIIKDADDALYEAKRLGRNRYVAGACCQQTGAEMPALALVSQQSRMNPETS